MMRPGYGGGYGAWRSVEVEAIRPDRRTKRVVNDLKSKSQIQEDELDFFENRALVCAAFPVRAALLGAKAG